MAPEIAEGLPVRATRIERYIVACYDAEDGGYFRPHRDNTTKGTAHRRFAVSINLNAEEFEGGDLRFPEFGPRTYRPPTGGAVVFSCSLLHEATPVTRGTRYAFLPFLYDEAGAGCGRRTAGRWQGRSGLTGKGRRWLKGKRQRSGTPRAEAAAHRSRSSEASGRPRRRASSR